MNNIILKTDPFKTIETTSVVSLFNGIHKPIKFVFMRQDVGGQVFTDNGGFIEILNGYVDTFPDTEINVGDFVDIYYFENTPAGIFETDNPITVTKSVEITAVNSTLGNVTSLETNEPYVSIDSNEGFLNFQRKFWYLQTSLKAFPNLVEEEIATIETKADSDLLLEVNVAPFLKNVVSMKDTNDYITSLSAEYKSMSYLYRIVLNSFWSGGSGVSVQNFDENDFFNYINGVKQILEKYGNNFADFVQNTEIEFQKLFTGLQKINPLSQIQTGLNYWYGFPLSVNLIMKDDVLFTKKVAKAIYDINGNILNSTTSTILIGENYNYFNIAKSFLTAYPTASYFVLQFIYEEIANPSNILYGSYAYRFDVERDCLEDGIYLNWLNSDSSRSYWLFKERNFNTLTAENEENFKPYSDDIETQNFDIVELENVAFKTVFVGGITTLEKWENLKTLFYSVNVNLLTNPETWETDGTIWKTVRIDKGSLRQWSSDDVTVEFEFKILLEQINIQSE